jgi:hypothetical protein
MGANNNGNSPNDIFPILTILIINGKDSFKIERQEHTFDILNADK